MGSGAGCKVSSKFKLLWAHLELVAAEALHQGGLVRQRRNLRKNVLGDDSVSGLLIGCEANGDDDGGTEDCDADGPHCVS